MLARRKFSGILKQPFLRAFHKSHFIKNHPCTIKRCLTLRVSRIFFQHQKIFCKRSLLVSQKTCINRAPFKPGVSFYIAIVCQVKRYLEYIKRFFILGLDLLIVLAGFRVYGETRR